MIKTELEKKLKLLKIPQDAYSLSGGLLNEVYCIEHTENGWDIYYSERGQKTGLKHFKDEQSACEYFYQWLLKIHKRNSKL